MHITIPSGVEKIIQVVNWALIDILISPNNKNFKWLDGKVLVGKSNANSNDFDIIVYAHQNITEITIPSNIKHIYPYCFYYNQKLRSVVFPDNSELRSIGQCAFQSTSIETFTIPSHVTEIGDYTFNECLKIRNIRFYWRQNMTIMNPPNILILNNTFQVLKDITIPPTNKNFKWLDGKVLLGKSNENSDDLDVIVYAHQNTTKNNSIKSKNSKY